MRARAMPTTPAGLLRWLLGAACLGLLAAAGLTLVGQEAPPSRDSEALQFTQPPVDPQAVAYAGLEQQLRRRPRDARAWVLKARADMAAGRHEKAVQGYSQALEIGSKVARDPNVWVEYAEAVGMAQGGTLTGQPLALIERALALDPTHPQALDLAGSAAWEATDFKTAVHHWQRLRQQLPSDDPRQSALQSAVEGAQRRARFVLPNPPDATKP